MLQEAILTSLLFDDTTEDPKDYEIVRRLDRLQSIPPHYIVHGTIDDKVAVAHSHEVVAKLKELGATYEYDELPGTDHLFDMDPSVMMDEMYGFIKKHL